MYDYQLIQHHVHIVSSPGSYNPEKKPPLKVAWPMQFGSPDWTQVPCLQKRTLKTEVRRLDLASSILWFHIFQGFLTRGLWMSCRQNLDH